ncbi:ICOS ligand-like [Conger conger]|uniref:ICOS ligand-like n=1 Tax=Conger conger TaxID=82655 RepID=UPI002A5A1579|nr:ICOS ligand-like [Conger conger]
MLIIWTTGFLFSMTSLDACVIGMVGESAVLPCVYNGTFGLDSGDVSVEWRTGSELVHTSALGKDGEVARSVSLRNGTRLVTDVIRNGNVSLLVSDVTVRDSQSYDCYLTRPGVKSSAHLCTVCLSAAAHFTHPVVLRQGGAEGEEVQFICHSRGGFPKPRVHWFIDDTEHPLVDTVRTYSTLLPDSELYNITSILSVNVTHDMTVSCLMENRLLSENLTSFTFGVEASPMVGRASEAMWMFTTALCVLVVALVVSVVGYQIKQDYDRRHNPQKPQESEDSSIADQKERVILEHLNSLTETTV